MALKLAIDVPVNDGDFQAFMGLFAKFQAAAEKTPEIWEAIGAKTEAAKRDFLSAATALNLQAEARASVAESAKQMATASDKTASAWKKIGAETKSIAGNLASMTGSLFSLTAFTGVFAGLAGFAGSLFGIPSLAASVSERRRQAIGYGADYGRLASFGVNFSRYFDPNAVAGGVASGQFDIQSPEYLALANSGLGRGGDTLDVSLSLVQQTRSQFAGVSPENIGPTLRARHLDAMFSPEDIARMERTSPEEFMAQREAASKDAKTFELMEPALRRLQDFRTQLDNSESVMSAKIAQGLSSAIPQLTKLSGSITHLIETASSNPTIAKWIGQATSGLEFFAKEIGSDQFKDDEKKLFDEAGSFVTGMEILADKLVGFVTAAGRFADFVANPSGPSSGPEDRNFSGGIEPNADRLAVPYRPHGPHHGDLPQGDTPGPGAVFRARYPGSSTAQAAPPANEMQQELVDRIQRLRPDLTNEQCVTLAFASAGIPYTNPEILSLRAGPSATSQKLPIGTPVMTHFDWKRGYGDSYAAGGTGTAGIGRDHMGVIAGYNPDGSVILMNQWAGSGGPRLTTYKPGDRPGTEHDADAYSAILDAQGLPAGTYEGNPLRRQTLRDIGYDRFAGSAMAIQKMHDGAIAPPAPKAPAHAPALAPDEHAREKTSMLDHYPGLHRIDETSVVDHTSGAVLVHVAGAHYSVTV